MAQPKNWDGKAKGSPLGNRIFIKLITLFGPLSGYLLLCMVAWHYAFFDKKGILALRRFRKQVGMKKTTVFDLYRHFYSFGLTLIDRSALLLLKKTPYTYTFDKEDIIAEALKKEHGTILLSAHCGNWEIAGNILAEHFTTAINAVMLDNEQANIKEVFKEVLEKRRFNIIPFSEDGLEMVLPIREALRKNEIVCFHGDRVLGSAMASLPFLGKEAMFPTGPFIISAITGAPIVPVFMMKTSMLHFTATAYDPIVMRDVNRHNREERIREAMQSFVTLLESVVREHPYQWFNFYDFWEQ